jgi:hypothetical protein
MQHKETRATRSGEPIMTMSMALVLRLVLYLVVCIAAPAVIAYEVHHPIERRLHDVVRRGADADFDSGF